MKTGFYTRNLFGFVFLSLVTAIPVGCGSSQTRTIQVQGTPAELGVASVEIHNFRGDVKVIVDPRRTEPQIKASFRHDSFVTKPTRNEAFRGAPVVASYQRQANGVVLRIETAPGLASATNFSTDLTVRMPACSGVVIRTTDGAVDVKDAAGFADITNSSSGTRSAPITYRTDAAVTGPVTLTTNKGDVFFSPGLDSTGQFTLSTNTGDVRFSAKVGELTGVNLSNPLNWTGTLNGGQNPVLLRSESGSVEVRLREPVTRVASMP